MLANRPNRSQIPSGGFRCGYQQINFCAHEMGTVRGAGAQPLPGSLRAEPLGPPEGRRRPHSPNKQKRPAPASRARHGRRSGVQGRAPGRIPKGGALRPPEGPVSPPEALLTQQTKKPAPASRAEHGRRFGVQGRAPGGIPKGGALRPPEGRRRPYSPNKQKKTRPPPPVQSTGGGPGSRGVPLAGFLRAEPLGPRRAHGGPTFVTPQTLRGIPRPARTCRRGDPASASSARR